MNYLVVKVSALEVPPPGVGLYTVTWSFPAIAMSAAVITAVNWVEETNVVVRLDPFHRTTDPLTKLLPLIVRTKSVPPAAVEAGLRLFKFGSGLFIVSDAALEVPPPGADVNTVTEALPAAAMSDAVIAAVNRDGET